MSDDKQTKEVKDEELDKVSGGHGELADAGKNEFGRGGHRLEDQGGRHERNAGSGKIK
jgi:hypothetical protein